jgi:hypothetical protein
MERKQNIEEIFENAKEPHPNNNYVESDKRIGTVS